MNQTLGSADAAALGCCNMEYRPMRGIVLKIAGAAFAAMAAGGVAAAQGAKPAAKPEAQQQILSPRIQAFREIYKELVEINTTDSVGDT